MVIPAIPTIATIVQEGLNKAGLINPPPIKTTRATTQWFEEIKQDIWEAMKKPVILATTGFFITNPGQVSYNFPSDYSSMESDPEILDGGVYAQAQGGSVNTIILNAADNSQVTDMIGREVIVYAGTGIGQINRCIGYDFATKVATMLQNWTVSPDATSQYILVDNTWNLTEEPAFRETSNPIRDYPSKWYSEDGVTSFSIWPIPYRESNLPWGVRLKYFVNLLTLDEASALHSLLLQRWRNVFISGIYAKALDDMNDDRAEAKLSSYKKQVVGLGMRENFGDDIGDLQCEVLDY